MKIRVVWRKRIRNRLHTAAFMMRERGRSRTPLKAAVREIGERLSSNPLTAGESRNDRERVLIVAPLTVRFEVFEQ